MLSYRGRTGNQYLLGKKIGTGGEGSVYHVENSPNQVAKIFHEGSKDPQFMRRKIETMLDMNFQPVVDNILRVAWPQDILVDEKNNFRGYVMPKVENPFEIFNVYREGAARNRILPNYTWKYSIQYAYNLSWVCWYLHLNGIVIGDMNMKNILINTKGEVVMIDCDSFNITNRKTGEEFPCTVGLQEMLAPELQTVGNLKNGKFTKESDDFSLAIHIFRLLMKNADPFGFKLIDVRRSSSSLVNASDAIVNGECVYVRPVPGKAAPSWVPDFNMLPQNIRQAFDKTFNYTALTAIRNIKRRTTAEEWNRALLPLALKEPNPNLAVCSKDPHHIYPAHNNYCPWCGAVTKR